MFLGQYFWGNIFEATFLELKFWGNDIFEVVTFTPKSLGTRVSTAKMARVYFLFLCSTTFPSNDVNLPLQKP